MMNSKLKASGRTNAQAKPLGRFARLCKQHSHSALWGLATAHRHHMRSDKSSVGLDQPNPTCNRKRPTAVGTTQLLAAASPPRRPLPPSHPAPPQPLVHSPAIRRLHLCPAPAAKGPQRHPAVAMEDTEATNTTTTSTSTAPTFASPLFSFSKPGASFGFGFGFDATPAPSFPPPPPVEVLLSEESPVVSAAWEPVVIDDSLSIYKGRVSTSDVFGVKNSDLVPGKYEGGLKLWEGSLDLVKTLNSEINNGKLLLQGKNVLELGCGHGLPGIFAGLKGAGLIHFQDFNAEVLKYLTIPNVKENLFKESSEGTCTHRSVGFFAGDWSEIDKLLLCGDPEHGKTSDNTEDKTSTGYDIILMAETVYTLSSLPNLYRLIKKCLRYPGGVVYMAGKKHYFGVGGGTRHFLRLVEEDGVMQPELLNDVADGSSNVREVWKFSIK